jgi:ribosome biogenesis GTPase
MVKRESAHIICGNDTNRHLTQLGWTSHFQIQLQNDHKDNVVPARVIGVRKNYFHVDDGKSAWLATTAGSLKHQAQGAYPVTGDWVLMSDRVIFKVLNRKNALSRGAAGSHGRRDGQPQQEQVIAANLDTVFIVCGLDRDFNLRRIERCLTLVYNCGLSPVVILTKADLHHDPMPFVSEVETIAFGVSVHVVSALDGRGLLTLESYLSPGQTATMIGSSGAGKSTLVNRLCGKPMQATGPVSDRIGKGRHTTASRDLVVMPQGGMVIDNPGIREIALWTDDDGINVAFPEVESFAGECRFSNCSHMHEPGCRVLQAVVEGEILQDRLASYHKMKRELVYLSHRKHKSADRVEKEQWQEVALKIRAIKKMRHKG